ncbi:MAG: T9SS type A sorting domain-containing protein, partial [Xanthomarina sp.]
RTANDDYVGRLWISPTSATTYRIGVGTGGTLNVIDTTDHNIGDTIFIVFSYDIDNNVVSAWINPTLGGAQPAANITEASASTGNVFNQFMIRQDNNTKTPFIVMDELRIATSWADVTPSTLSISQFNASTFNVYPNPTSTGFVNITSKSNESMQVAVFDILGKQILNQTVNNNRLDVSTLTTGVYILKISQNGQAITKKLVVK